MSPGKCKVLYMIDTQALINLPGNVYYNHRAKAAKLIV